MVFCLLANAHKGVQYDECPNNKSLLHLPNNNAQPSSTFRVVREMQLNAGLWPFVSIAKQSQRIRTHQNAALTKMCLMVPVPEYLRISNHRFARCSRWMPKLDCDISRFAMPMPAGVISHFPPVQWACYVRRIDWLALVNGGRQPRNGRARSQSD